MTKKEHALWKMPLEEWHIPHYEEVMKKGEKTRIIPVKALKRAKELIKDPKCWIQGSAHRTIDDLECYCMSGAINQACWEQTYPKKNLNYMGEHPKSRNVMKAASTDIVDIFRRNDDFRATHKTVMRYMTRLIKNAEAKKTAKKALKEEKADKT